MYDRYDYLDIDSAGIDAVVVTNTNTTTYQAYRRAHNTKFKLIPYMHTLDSNITRTGICFFSEKAYTIWEAEGDTNYVINLNNSGGMSYYEPSIGVNGIQNDTSKHESCYIIQGPNNYCNLANSKITTLPMNYTANFRLKINWRNTQNHPDSIKNYANQIICRLSVTTQMDTSTPPTTIADSTLIVDNLLPLDGYTEIKLKYRAFSKSLPSNLLKQIHKLTAEDTAGLYTVIPNVEFKVYFNEIPELSLYVDKITLYDTYGNILMNSSSLSDFSLPNEITFQLGDPFNSSEVVGWYPIDEPDLIDMQNCLAKLDTLINTAKTDLHLIPGVACSWDGSLFGPGTPSKLIEYSKRGKYNGSIMHKYLYDDPHVPSDGPDYFKGNITCYIANLNYYQVADPNFICSIQSGKWSNDSAHVLRKIQPSPKQFLYNTNLALLYGAKGIDINDFYYYINDSNVVNRTGMMGIYASNSAGYGKVPSDIYRTLRDTISPLLKGDFGILLKKLKQTYQDQINSYAYIYQNGTLIASNVVLDIDYGYFNNPSAEDKKYVMLLNRYYSPDKVNNQPYSINYNYSGVTQTNYMIKEYYKNQIIHKTVSNNNLILRPQLNPGECALYEIMPSIKYGGQIIVNDTVKTCTELIGDLQINENKKLYIKDTTYTVSSLIYVKNGGSISRIGRGNIVFSGAGKITNEVWTNSLFYTCQNRHPKLIWGALTGTQKYVIYRKLGATFAFDSIGVVNSTSSNLQQCFVDVTTDINLGQVAGHDIYYKVKKINGQKVQYTNQVNVPLTGGAIDKSNEIIIKEFVIEQNYPNPFNSTTHIKYMIPKTGKVSVKLYDILGKEIKNLYEGIREQGVYEIELNCNNMASGVYIYRIQYDDKVLSKKIMLLK